MRPSYAVPALILLLGACAQPTPAPTPTETTVVTVTGEGTVGEGASISTTETQDFALERARELNGYEVYSAMGLEFELVSEGFSREDARWAVDNLGEDWNNNAVEAVHELNQFASYSRVGMLQALKDGGFTQDEAQHGVEHASVDYRDNALQMAYVLYDVENEMLFDDLRTMLIDDHGFLPEEADWAIDNLYPEAVG